MKLFGNISHEPSDHQQRAAGDLRPAAPEARPAPGAAPSAIAWPAPAQNRNRRDDAGALHGPERVGVEVLVDEAEVVQVEAEVERRHPDDGDAAQRVEAVEAEAFAPGIGRRRRGDWRRRRHAAPAQRAASGTHRVLPLRRAPSVRTPGQRRSERPRRARQRRPHRDVGEGRCDAQAPREAAPPERFVVGKRALLRRPAVARSTRSRRAPADQRRRARTPIAAPC